MTNYVIPILLTILTWWFSTGLILWLGRTRHEIHMPIMIAATGLAIIAFLVLFLTSQSTMANAYFAFFAAIILWGWHELSFIFGMITGPRRTECPTTNSWTLRFKSATESILYHEIGLLLTGFVIAFLTLESANKIALYTFAVLWVMRISAKLNLFFGVPHIAVSMMPKRLAYLASYFRQGTISLFFPGSVTAAILAFAALVFLILSSEHSQTSVGLVLVTTLLALAIFEHWCLIIPFDETAIWATWFKNKATKTLGSAGEPAKNQSRLLVDKFDKHPWDNEQRQSVESSNNELKRPLANLCINTGRG